MSRRFGARRAPAEARELFRPLPQRYDLLAEVLSFGQNGRWRKRMVDRIVEAAPGNVLDVATGTAGVAMQIAARSGARVVGLDLTPEMLLRGRERIVRRGQAARIHVLQGDAQRLPFHDGVFDALSFTYLLRYVPDPAATLREMVRVLRPGGRMASLEFFVPSNPMALRAWRLYTRALLPAAAAVAGRGWLDVGRFLGPSISEHYRRYPLAWHADAWSDAGMVDVGMTTMSLGGGLVMWGTKRHA